MLSILQIWCNGLSLSLRSTYQRFHPHVAKKSQRLRTHWRFPPSGSLKINIDGAFSSKLRQGGVGVVVRNECGQCIATFARLFLLLYQLFKLKLKHVERVC